MMRKRDFWLAFITVTVLWLFVMYGLYRLLG